MDVIRDCVNEHVDQHWKDVCVGRDKERNQVAHPEVSDDDSRARALTRTTAIITEKQQLFRHRRKGGGGSDTYTSI